MAVSGGTAAPAAANPSGRNLVVAAVLLDKLLLADRGTLRHPADASFRAVARPLGMLARQHADNTVSNRLE